MPCLVEARACPGRPSGKTRWRVAHEGQMQSVSGAPAGGHTGEGRLMPRWKCVVSISVQDLIHAKCSRRLFIPFFIRSSVIAQRAKYL